MLLRNVMINVHFSLINKILKNVQVNVTNNHFHIIIHLKVELNVLMIVNKQLILTNKIYNVFNNVVLKMVMLFKMKQKYVILIVIGIYKVNKDFVHKIVHKVTNIN